MLALLVLALAGCGRRGPLELPPDGATPVNQASAPQPGQTTATAPPEDTPIAASLDTGVGEPPNSDAPPAKPGPLVKPAAKSFLLDPLVN